MKTDRALRAFRRPIETACKQCGLPPPSALEVMTNYFGRPEKSFGQCILNNSPSGYKVRVRIKQYDNNQELIPRSKEDILSSICHEVSHLRYRIHNAQQVELSKELFTKAKSAISTKKEVSQ